MSRSGGQRPPDDQAKLKKILDELTKREENKFCADCGCRGPRWASINLGVFICIACSGIHRSLGVHLTFVRSVNLDSWTAEQVAQMQKWGNARAKEYYEANVPRDYRIPNEHSSVREKEMWIREKYERKRFVSHDHSRKPHSDDEESDDDRRSDRRERRADRSSTSRTNSRTNSRGDRGDRGESSSARMPSSSSRRPEPVSAPKAPAPVTHDILSFDAFTADPAPAPQPVAAPSQQQPQQQQSQQPQAPKQDEWAAFGGSTNTQGGFGAADAFAPTPAPTNQHANKMANIMASFGSAPTAPSAFPPQQGMMPGAPMGMATGMGMPMNMGMAAPMGGMMAPPNMGGGMNMGMGMMGQPQQPGFMNSMMGMQQPPANMMNPMQNPMFGAAQPMNPMMGGNSFPGGAASMGFPGQPVGMNPMATGMNMNAMGFQQPHQQQQQQQAQNGLSQPFVNLGSAPAGKNPFF